MTPEGPPGVEPRAAALTGEWHGEALSGTGRLRLAEHGVRVEPDGGVAFEVPYASLTGTAWRGDAVTMFGAAGWIRGTGAPGLDAFWVGLQERACALPELTTGLRALGSRRGGDAQRQARFFAPLLQARRRLEEQREIRWRLAAFEAQALRRRVEETVRALAAERYPDAPPAERALAACLIDECAALFAALDALGEAAALVADSDDAGRFAAWRAWTGRAREVFEAADRAWGASLRWLEPGPPVATTATRRSRRRGS
jgi:hypothetical protein